MSYLGYVAGSVKSVAGKAGDVELNTVDVGLNNVTNDAQLKIASNLSDLNDAATARTNLGLGNAAVANILGTVSQSSGVPTGAIIERGSNANGQYVRFADGTQICVKRDAFSAPGVTYTSGAIYSSGESAWNYPAAFSGDTIALIPTRTTFGGAWCGAGETPNTINTGYSVLMWSSSITVPVTWDGIAIGRWY